MEIVADDAVELKLPNIYIIIYIYVCVLGNSTCAATYNYCICRYDNTSFSIHIQDFLTT